MDTEDLVSSGVAELFGYLGVTHDVGEQKVTCPSGAGVLAEVGTVDGDDC